MDRHPPNGADRYRVRIVRGRMYLGGVLVRSLVDHDAREIRIGAWVPRPERRRVYAMARVIERVDGLPYARDPAARAFAIIYRDPDAPSNRVRGHRRPIRRPPGRPRRRPPGR